MELERIWAVLVRRVTYPLWLWRDGLGRAPEILGSFDVLKAASRNELEASQLRRLKRLVQLVNRESSFYRMRFSDANLPVDNIRLDDLRRLPVLTKAEIRSNLESMLPDCYKGTDRVSLASTGGSTGQALRFFRSSNVYPFRKAQELFFDSWAGVTPGQKSALFVAAAHAGERTVGIRSAIRHATYERMLRFDPSEPTEEYLEQFLSEFRRHAPEVVRCFPNSLAVFCEFVRAQGVSVPAVKKIFCTGESLYDWQKDLFREVLGGEVYERYATKESGIIASECNRHDGLHVFTEGCVVEVLDSLGRPCPSGKVGRIVVTDLVNTGTPLIRYEIGDMGVLADETSCACGSSLPRLERVLGRDRDVIIDSNGVRRAGYLFVEELSKRNLDGKFQIVQESRSEVVVFIERGHNVSGEDINELLSCYRAILGPKIDVSSREVDTIEREPSGKFSYVRSKVAREGR